MANDRPSEKRDARQPLKPAESGRQMNRPAGAAPGQAIRPGAGKITREMILARFIRLSANLLSAPSPQESAAVMVNRISEIVRVDRAVLVSLTDKHAIVSVTGGGVSAQDSSFADAVETARDRYKDQKDPVIVSDQDDDALTNAEALEKVKNAMGGTHILWLPLWLKRDEKTPAVHALWLERWRGAVWDKADIELLQHMALFLGHSLIRPKTAMPRPGKRMVRLAVAIAVVVFLCLPMTSSVTAPARVVPDRPHHIFAPMEGILQHLYVQPGQRVKADDILFKYDARVLEKRLDEAYRNVAVARAKLARLEGAAHRDPEARAELPVQRIEVERAEADVEFYKKQVDRAEVRSGKPGVVVLDDPDALIGAVLQTGQAVLSIADPSKTKLRIMVPASDAGFVKEGARADIRLDRDPLKSIPAFVSRIGFDVQLSENHVPSVLTEAIWPGEKPGNVAPGQRGLAKIYGRTTRIGMQILRKPIIAFRSLIGF